MMTTVQKIIDFFATDIISVVFSSRGLNFLSLKADEGTQRIDLRLIQDKQEQSPMEELIIRETISFLETGRHQMPLDLSNFTAFQQSVFRVVGSVEPGRITTYKGIAELLGKPGGAQAVGNAIAKNPVSYFMPTHRVLPQKGIGICRTGAGHLREKLLAHEGHEVDKLRGNYVCNRKKCCMEQKPAWIQPGLHT